MFTDPQFVFMLYEYVEHVWRMLIMQTIQALEKNVLIGATAVLSWESLAAL